MASSPIHYPLRPNKVEEKTFLEYLENLYTDLSSPVSFTSPTTVLAHIKRSGVYENIGLKRLTKYMSKFPAYTVNKERRRVREYRRYVVEIPGSIECDLMVVNRFSKTNRNIRYLLVGIDIFSAEGHVELLVDKTGPLVVKQMKALLSKFRNPVTSVYSDIGNEFRQKELGTFLKSQQIRQFFAKQGLKSSKCERFIRYLRGVFRRYRISRNTTSFVDAIPSLLDGYNNRPLKRLGGLSPYGVNMSTAGIVSDYLRSVWKDRSPPGPPKFPKNSKVRIVTEKTAFDKYRLNYSEEVFTVDRHFERDSLNIYQLRDCSGQVIDGYFYSSELEAVDVSARDLTDIKRFVTEEMRNGERYVLVEFKGAGGKAKCREWVRKADVSLE